MAIVSRTRLAPKMNRASRRNPADTVAVIRFSGSTAPDAVEHQARLLARLLATTRWRPLGAPFAQFYDPPWTLPPLRRNEVAMRVEG
ncbi:hypothetical protein CH338_20410 [Rhodoplanes elegans]|uniref:Heme-binding protein n=2 Tax=Rhodoplanes elegans TaxID=29408 RepID=A0A327K949_9BRAD|nr:hypothetical protein CH338_20410 [Rhodoplanes elegans]